MNKKPEIMSVAISSSELRAGIVRARTKAAFYRVRRAAAAPALRATIAGGILALTASCAALSSFNLLSLQDDVSLGANAFAEVQSTAKTINSGPQYEQLKRVTTRLVNAAHTVDPEIVEAFEWEAVLIDDPNTVNAWCLPGGKMAAYTGILPVTESDAGLAVVMGHEIAHATLRHGTSAVSRQMGVEILIQIAQGTQNVDPQLAGMASNLFLTLPMGRRAESGADARGLVYMATAGYDPREAIAFWSRMAELSGGGAPPEFLSTHPSHDTRIDDLEELMPEAMQIWQASQGQPSP